MDTQRAQAQRSRRAAIDPLVGESRLDGRVGLSPVSIECSTRVVRLMSNVLLENKSL